jgi:uncharacterized membrane protein
MKIPHFILQRKIDPLTAEVLTESLHSQIKFSRTGTDIFADKLTVYFGSVTFLVFNFLVFVAWLVLNIPVFGFTAFDPFPFGLLTTIVSLEAIFLSIIVLISQNRQSRIADIRQKVQFEVDVRDEEETTMILQMIHEMHQHLGLKSSNDKDLEFLEKKTDIQQIKQQVELED